jgi:hypothetical protein
MHNYVNPYELEVLGYGLMLLGNLTVIRAGAMLIGGRQRAALAHRVFARLMTYGALAM